MWSNMVLFTASLTAYTKGKVTPTLQNMMALIVCNVCMASRITLGFSALLEGILK